MSRTADFVAQIARQRADIGALRNAELNIPLGKLHPHARTNGDELRRVHLDIARGKLDDMAFACSLVGLLPIYLDGGIRRRHLLLRPEHLLDRLLRKATVTGFHRRFTGPCDRTIAIVGIGPHAERDGGPIRFIVPSKVRAQPGGGADADGQHTACQRIERARMADALLAEDATAAIDHVMGRHAAGLVDADYQRQPRFSSLHLAHTASCSAART